MTAIRAYGPGDPDAVRLVDRSVAFAACDPGSRGMVLAWRAGASSRWPCAPDRWVPITSNAGGADLAGRVCAELGVRVFVLEDQYLGRQTRNFATTKKLIFTAGILVGVVMARADLADVVSVHPATWQAGLPKHSESKKRAQLHANRILPTWLPSMGAALREGAADALGLADWFQGTT